MEVSAVRQPIPNVAAVTAPAFARDVEESVAVGKTSASTQESARTSGWIAYHAMAPENVLFATERENYNMYIYYGAGGL